MISNYNESFGKKAFTRLTAHTPSSCCIMSASLFLSWTKEMSGLYIYN